MIRFTVGRDPKSSAEDDLAQVIGNGGNRHLAKEILTMRIHIIVAAATVVMSTGLAVQAQQAGDESKLYPVDKRVQVFEDALRPCTQLEHSAGIAAAECGSLPLGEVAKKFFETSEED